MRLKLVAGFLSIITVFVGLLARTNDVHTHAVFLTAMIVVLHQWVMLAIVLLGTAYRRQLQDKPEAEGGEQSRSGS